MSTPRLNETDYKRILYDIYNGTGDGTPIRECLTPAQLEVFDALDIMNSKNDGDVNAWNEDMIDQFDAVDGVVSVAN
jgi:hypothetical protein